MFVDMRPGDHIRLGENAMMVILGVNKDRVEFAVEGVEVQEMEKAPSSPKAALHKRRKGAVASRN